MISRKILKIKKGLSGIIATVILIAITLAMAVVVWGIVSNLTEGRLDQASSCFNVFEKISLNKEWTCYNSTSNETVFSVSIGDVEISEVQLLISGSANASTIVIPSDNGYTRMYGGVYSNSITLPTKNSAMTYVANLTQIGISGKPNSISIYPVVKRERCQVSDTIYQIDSCHNVII